MGDETEDRSCDSDKDAFMKVMLLHWSGYPKTTAIFYGFISLVSKPFNVVKRQEFSLLTTGILRRKSQTDTVILSCS